jgi:hypothetical protein
LYVEDDWFDHVERNKVCILTVTKLEIVMLTIQYEFMFGICFVYDPGDDLRQPSPTVLAVKQLSISI